MPHSWLCCSQAGELAACGQVWGRWFPISAPSPQLPQPVGRAQPVPSIDVLSSSPSLERVLALSLPRGSSCCPAYLPPWSRSSQAPAPHCPCTSAHVYSLVPMLSRAPSQHSGLQRSCKLRPLFPLVSIFISATLWEFLTPSSEHFFISFRDFNQVIVTYKCSSFAGHKL